MSGAALLINSSRYQLSFTHFSLLNAGTEGLWENRELLSASLGEFIVSFKHGI